MIHRDIKPSNLMVDDLDGWWSHIQSLDLPGTFGVPAPKPPAADAYAAMMTAFNEGKVGMIINGPWEVNNIRNAENFGGVENLGIAPVPAGSIGIPWAHVHL